MAVHYKLGKLPAQRPHGLRDLTVYASGPLPAVPSSVDVPDAAYPVDGNDQYGDCTIAGAAHLVSAWDVEVDESDPVPSNQEVVDQYFTITGGQDSGCVEADVLKLWQTKGLFGGPRIAGYAPVKDLVDLHASVAFYGGCYLGIACPESAQEQFQAGQPWTYVKGSPVEGGHCIVALGYLASGSLLCATWGGVAEVTPGFLAHFLDEAWCVLPNQIVERKGDALGINLAALQADLDRI